MTRYILLDPQGGEGGGSPAPQPKDPAEAFQSLLKKHGDDGVRLAEKLFGENYELRQKNSALTGKVPGEGSVVLQGDDARDWQKYREFGKPGDLKKSLDDGLAAINERDRFARGELYRRAAELGGYKPSLFAREAEHDRLRIEIVEVMGKDGKAVTQAVVKGEGESTTPINEYVDKHWSDLKAALGGPAEEKKTPSGTPPRRPFGMPAPDASNDADEVVRKKLQASGIYRAGL